MKLIAHMTHYDSHAKLSQVGGNHHNNIGMTWLASECVFIGHMCHCLLSVDGHHNIRMTLLSSEYICRGNMGHIRVYISLHEKEGGK
jgi:hypothetical protein